MKIHYTSRQPTYLATTNPNLNHANDLIALAKKLITQVKEKHANKTSHDEIEHHFSVLQAMVAEECDVLRIEKDRLNREHKPVAQKIRGEMNALDAKRAELHDLAYQAAQLRSSYLAPKQVKSTTMIMNSLSKTKPVAAASETSARDTADVASAKEAAAARARELILDRFANVLGKTVPTQLAQSTDALASEAVFAAAKK